MNTRVTASRVVDAFKQIGLTPAQEHFVVADESGNPAGCCGLSALFAQGRGNITTLDRMGSVTGSRLAAEFLGLDPGYAYGFACGWDDGMILPRESCESYEGFDFELVKQGFLDGRDAYEEACAIDL